MGYAISDLAAVTTVNDDDVFEVEQVGGNKKFTKAQLDALLLPDGGVDLNNEFAPRSGNVIYNDGTDFRTGQRPQWRTVHPNAYVPIPATSSTITFAGGGPTDGIKLKGGDYFAVGYPVRAVFAASPTLPYYGICTAISDTLLTISGAALPGTSILSLEVGSPGLLKHVQLSHSGTTYNSSLTLPITKGCQHRWQGGTGHLVAYSCAHMNTSSTTAVDIKLASGASYAANGAGIVLAAGTATTYGAFVDSGPAILTDRSKVIVNANDVISMYSVVLGGFPLADFLIACLTFVVP
jgi:hypothetical protein